MAEEKRDSRREVTEDVIHLIEQGAAPWMRPWKTGEAGRLPFNPTSGLQYKGGNIITLLVAKMQARDTMTRAF